ncbi:MAG: hypothetical protein ABI168_04095 [Ginsengibacter sp.]
MEKKTGPLLSPILKCQISLKPDAISNNLFTISNNQLYDVNNSSPPFNELLF